MPNHHRPKKKSDNSPNPIEIDKQPNDAPENENVIYDYNEFTGEIERTTVAAAHKNSASKSNSKRAMESYARYSSIGFQMLAAMLLGAFGGLQLDKWLQTSPWLTVLLTLLGVAMAMYIVIKETTKPS